MDDSRIKDVSSLLAAFFDEEQLRRGRHYARFFGSWREIAGERLAAHSRVADVENGILVVEAEHPGWIQLLQLRQNELLEAVNRRFADLDLRGIVFRLGVETRREATSRSETEEGETESEAASETFSDRSGAGEQGVARPAPSLEDIGDSKLRTLLQGLKKSMDEEK